jgi:signal transduction histidine kinase
MHICDWYRGNERDLAIIRAGLETTLREGYGFAEASLQVKSGKKIPMYFTAVRVMIENKPCFVGIGIDISDRKKAESAIQTANKKLNILSSITRHDILNKLTALHLFLELAETQPVAGGCESYVRLAHEAADDIQRQIEFTRYYQDIGMQEPQWTVLPGIVQSAFSQVDFRGIASEIQCGGFEIFVDPLIEKVFYNLADNSIRHGGTVTRIEVSAAEQPEGLAIVYTDNGRGIRESDRKNLFTKGFGENTGLGLFLSKEILSITGITIRENGRPKNGVRFEITIPEGGYRALPDRPGSGDGS